MQEYRCEAASLEGFVQQLAVAYLARGYWFYVTGQVPHRKDPREVDRKLLDKYAITASRKRRSLRKQQGLANMQYIRHERFFVLLATHGQHRFFEPQNATPPGESHRDAGGRERRIRDARHTPIVYRGYSMSVRSDKVCVRIARDEYRLLKAHFEEIACRRSAEALRAEFERLPFVAYKPVRQQVICLLRLVNRNRGRQRQPSVPATAFAWQRRIVSPFIVNPVVKAGLCSPPVGKELKRP